MFNFVDDGTIRRLFRIKKSILSGYKVLFDFIVLVFVGLHFENQKLFKIRMNL